MNKSESKYFNTAIRMDEALITLLEKKDFDYITIKEICDVAKVNRTTFYLHYENVSDLLAEALEYMNTKFLSCFQSDVASTIENIRVAEKSELIFIAPEYLEPYLQFIKDNQKIFVAALSKPEIYESDTKFDMLYQHILEPILQRFSYPEQKRRFLMSFYIHGIMGIVMEWMKGGCNEDISEISKMIVEIVLPDVIKM